MSRNYDECHFPLSSPYVSQDFQGVSQFLMRGAMSFSGMERAEEVQHEDDMSDDSSQMLGEKKRRLNLEQVKALEKSFESGNKLEPERKMQLARALGMQPRQIAIWFQNRRARCKNKKLEKDYDVLKRQFEALKTDNDALKSQNKNLQTQLVALRSRESTGANIIKKENEGSWGNGGGNSCDYVNLNTTSKEDSKIYPQYPSNKNTVLLPFMNDTSAAASLTQFFNGSSGQDHHHHVQISQKTDHVPASNQGLCNMFGGIEENPEFWTWSEQPNFR